MRLTGAALVGLAGLLPPSSGGGGLPISKTWSWDRLQVFTYGAQHARQSVCTWLGFFTTC